MPFPTLFMVQDTTLVSVARDSLATVSAWATVGLAIAFVMLVLVLVLILFELRALSKSWQGLLGLATDRSRPLIDSANSAAQNVDYITQVVRADVDRLNGAFSGLTKGLEDASLDAQGRLRDMSALLDLAQTEAEDAVLDAATRVRAIRGGAGTLARSPRRKDSPVASPPEKPEEPGSG